MKAAHISLVSQWRAKGPPIELIVIKKTWEEQAVARWGDQWSTTEVMALATTVDYMDTHAN
eukprot:5450101-Karenia_brevis.AAC.1